MNCALVVVMLGSLRDGAIILEAPQLCLPGCFVQAAGLRYNVPMRDYGTTRQPLTRRFERLLALLGLTRGRADHHFERAYQFADARRFDLAVREMSRAIYYAPNSAELYARRGMFYLEMGRYSRAEQDFGQALALDSGEMPGHYGLGQMAFMQQRYQDAVRHFSDAVQADPARYEPFYFRAVARYYLRELVGAIEDMSQARALMGEEGAPRNEAAMWLNTFRNFA